MSRSTIVWISGATEGLGLGLACTCPYEDARIINLSRRRHPDLETLLLFGDVPTGTRPSAGG